MMRVMVDRDGWVIGDGMVGLTDIVGLCLPYLEEPVVNYRSTERDSRAHLIAALSRIAYTYLRA